MKVELYHTSNIEIVTPDVFHSRRNLDFGKGFYLTPIRQQAINYGKTVSNLWGTTYSYIYFFDFEETEFEYKVFKAYNEEWLDFVTKCRRGEDTFKYELVEGGIANDRVFDTVDLYFSGNITKQQALERLAFVEPNWQICIRSQKVIDKCLKFKEAIKI